MKMGLHSLWGRENDPLVGTIFYVVQKRATLRTLKRGILKERVIKPVKKILQDPNRFAVIVTPINPEHPDAEQAVVIRDKAKAWPYGTTIHLCEFTVRPITITVKPPVEYKEKRSAPTSEIVRENFQKTRNIDRVWIISDQESCSKEDVIKYARSTLPSNYSVDQVKTIYL